MKVKIFPRIRENSIVYIDLNLNTSIVDTLLPGNSYYEEGSHLFWVISRQWEQKVISLKYSEEKTPKESP